MQQLAVLLAGQQAGPLDVAGRVDAGAGKGAEGADRVDPADRQDGVASHSLDPVPGAYEAVEPLARRVADVGEEAVRRGRLPGRRDVDRDRQVDRPASQLRDHRRRSRPHRDHRRRLGDPPSLQCPLRQAGEPGPVDGGRAVEPDRGLDPVGAQAAQRGEEGGRGAHHHDGRGPPAAQVTAQQAGSRPCLEQLRRHVGGLEQSRQTAPRPDHLVGHPEPLQRGGELVLDRPPAERVGRADDQDLGLPVSAPAAHRCG